MLVLAMSGSHGFLGSRLGPLLAASEQVGAIYRVDRFCDLKLWYLKPGVAITPETIDVVVHLGGMARAKYGVFSRAYLNEANVHSTSRIAKKAIREWKCRKFIFISSARVLGERSAGVELKSDECSPQSSYAKSKYAAEQILLESFDSLPVELSIIRLPTVLSIYGRSVVNRLLWLSARGFNFVPKRANARRHYISLTSALEIIAFEATNFSAQVPGTQCIILPHEGCGVSLHTLSVAAASINSDSKDCYNLGLIFTALMGFARLLGKQINLTEELLYELPDEATFNKVNFSWDRIINDLRLDNSSHNALDDKN